MFGKWKYKMACRGIKKYANKKMKDRDYKKMLKYWHIKVEYELEKRGNR